MARDTEIVAERRRRLREWIAERFGGSQAAFLADAKKRGHLINQGELSGLLRTKSFSERRARKLEIQADMPVGHLVPSLQPPDSAGTAPLSRIPRKGDDAEAIRIGLESLALAVFRASQGAASIFLEDVVDAAKARHFSAEHGFLAGLVDIARGVQSEEATAGKARRRAGSAGRTKPGK